MKMKTYTTLLMVAVALLLPLSTSYAKDGDDKKSRGRFSDFSDTTNTANYQGGQTTPPGHLNDTGQGHWRYQGNGYGHVRHDNPSPD